MICYIVRRGGGGWVIEAQRLSVDYYSDRVRAIDAAIDFAAKDGDAGRPAKVLAREWTHKGHLDLWARPIAYNARLSGERPLQWRL